LTSQKSMHRSRPNIDIFAVVSGSFNRFLPQIREAVTALSKLGITVLSPKSWTPVSEVNGFVILEKDKGSPAHIEQNHLSAIKRSDFLYVVNPGSYIGQSVALEIGYALSNRIPVYSSEHIQDEVFSSIITSGLSFNQIKNRIRKHKVSLRNSLLKSSPTLADLQNYIEGIVKARGFSKEEINNVALLLVEEVGELAKAIRLEIGLKLGKSYKDQPTSMELELADCLFYLLDLANLANINLEDALRSKEAINSGREWIKHLPRLASPLTPLEKKILNYISHGYVNKEIANRLCVSEQTIKNHMTSILRKLDANSRVEAASIALDQGWIPIE